MNYWDASALVPLIVSQTHSQRARKLYRRDPDLATWWGTPLECYSALMRLQRESALSAVALQAAETRLQFLREHWTEVLPSDALRRSAERILRVHTLRAADSLQLAAALARCRNDPEGVVFVSFDDRLRAAAYREGFKPA